MPYEFDLDKFKEKAHKTAINIAVSNNKDNMALQIENAMIESYIAGYKQCIDDYEINK